MVYHPASLIGPILLFLLLVSRLNRFVLSEGVCSYHRQKNSPSVFNKVSLCMGEQKWAAVSTVDSRGNRNSGLMEGSRFEIYVSNFGEDLIHISFGL